MKTMNSEGIKIHKLIYEIEKKKKLVSTELVKKYIKQEIHDVDNAQVMIKEIEKKVNMEFNYEEMAKKINALMILRQHIEFLDNILNEKSFSMYQFKPLIALFAGLLLIVFFVKKYDSILKNSQQEVIENEEIIQKRIRDAQKSYLKKEQQVESQNCNRDMVYASSSAENAEDYALKGNHRYALIEVKEAISGTEQALESCKDKVDTEKMDELSKNLSSLYKTKKLIQSTLSKNSSSSKPEIKRKKHATSKANCYYYEDLSNKTIQSANSMVSRGNIGQSLKETKRAKEYTIIAIRECTPYGDVSNLEDTLNILNSAIHKMNVLGY